MSIENKDPMQLFAVNPMIDNFGSLFRNEQVETKRMKDRQNLGLPAAGTDDSILGSGGLLQEAGLISNDMPSDDQPEYLTDIEPWEDKEYKYGKEYGDVAKFDASGEMSWEDLQKITPQIHEKQSETYYLHKGKVVDQDIYDNIMNSDADPEVKNEYEKFVRERYKYKRGKAVKDIDKTRYTKTVTGKDVEGKDRKLQAKWAPDSEGNWRWQLQGPDASQISQEEYTFEDTGKKIGVSGEYDTRHSTSNKAHYKGKHDDGKMKSQYLSGADIYEKGISLPQDIYQSLVKEQVGNTEGQGFEDIDWDAQKFFTWDEFNKLVEGSELSGLLKESLDYGGFTEVPEAAVFSPSTGWEVPEGVDPKHYKKKVMTTPEKFDLEDAISVLIGSTDMGQGRYGDASTFSDIYSGPANMVRTNKQRVYDTILEALENEQ